MILAIVKQPVPTASWLTQYRGTAWCNAQQALMGLSHKASAMPIAL